AIHGADTVHRDLTPSNVLLSGMGPRVVDFGIAGALDETTTSAWHLRRIGTSAFVAPEQARGKVVTSAADVFAWGGIGTFGATGRPPFGIGPAEFVLFRTVYEEPDLEGVPPDLADTVKWAMAKKPADRPSAPELFARLMGTSHAS